MQKILDDIIEESLKPVELKPKRLLLALSFVALALAWAIPDVDAAGEGGIISCSNRFSPNEVCYFITSTGIVANTKNTTTYTEFNGSIEIVSQNYLTEGTLPKPICGITSTGYVLGGSCPASFKTNGPYKKLFSNMSGLCGIKMDSSVYCMTIGGTDYGYSGMFPGFDWKEIGFISKYFSGSPGYYVPIPHGIKTDGSIDGTGSQNNQKIIVLNSGCWFSIKTDGTLGTNCVGFQIPDGKFKKLSASYPWSVTPIIDTFCGIRSDDTIGCYGTGAMNPPSGYYREISVATNEYACAVRISDSKVICWNNAGTVTTINTPAANSTVDPSQTVTYADGMSCTEDNYPVLSSVSWITPGFMFSTGSLVQEVFTGGSTYGCNGTFGTNCGYKIRNTNSSGDNIDILTMWNYDVSSIFRKESFQYPGSGSRSLMIADDFEPQIVALGSIRENEKFAANVWQFSSVQNPALNYPWAYYNPPGTNEQIPVYASGGTATIVGVNQYTQVVLTLTEFSVPPIGFRMGKATEFEKKQSCTVGNNSCAFDIVGNEYVCSPQVYNGYFGDCEIDDYQRCSPVVSSSGEYESGTPIDGSNVVTDTAGNIIAVAPRDTNIENGSISVSEVFTCSDYDGFLDIFPCTLQTIQKIWRLVTDSVGKVNGGVSNVNNTISSVGTGETTLSLTGTATGGVNLADTIFRGAWNGAFVENDFNKWAKFALLGSLFLMVLAVVFVIAIVNKK